MSKNCDVFNYCFFAMFSFFANANIPHQVCFYAEHLVRSFSTDMYIGDSTESLPIVICIEIGHGGIRSRLQASQHDFSFRLSFFCLCLRFFFFDTGFQVQHMIWMTLWAFYHSFASLFAAAVKTVLPVWILWSRHKILVDCWTTDQKHHL